MMNFKISVLSAWLLASAVWAFEVNAQDAVPTGEQINTFQQLSPEEREALLEVLGDNSGVLRDGQLEFPDIVSPLETEAEDADDVGDDLASEFEEEDIAAQINCTVDVDGRYVCEEIVEEEDLPLFDQELELEPFGYNLFAGIATTFAPATDIPVPPDYSIGPGDTIEVQLFGKENRQFSLVVRRDGTLNFPNIGPIVVMGRSFQELKQELLDRVSEDLIGISAAISMGALRSIRVLVVGDARTPGSYTVSGLSTISNALFVSGGISEVGSLRNIQVRRSGKLIRTMDLYDLLIRGDSKDDIRLQSGDVIFIPPVGATVSVGGYVNRPAIYELKGEKSVGEIVEVAGGLRPEAFPAGARIERISDRWERSFVRVDLSTPHGQQLIMRSGDILLIPPVLEEYREGVRLSGHVLRPGDFEWQEGLRLTDLIPSLDVLQRQADINYVLIRRETFPDKRVRALSANLEVALANPDSAENRVLLPRDTITVFNLEADRSEIVEPLLVELELQATATEPFEKVTIGGMVRAPGTYPYETGMRVSDLLRAGASLDEGAYVFEAEIARYKVIEGLIRKIELLKIKPDAALRGNLDEDILLRPYDSLQIRRVQDFREQLSVKLTGEVRFPGSYSFNPGDTLTEIIARAGGLTDIAFPQGGVFLRKELREREQEQIDFLTNRIESDLASLVLQTANEDESVTQAQQAGQTLLSKLSNTRATGRLVIDLGGMLENPDDPDYRVYLRDEDELLIPQFAQDVTVLGEVQFPTSHLHRSDLGRDDYINRSGGITQNAAKKQIYMVRANGEVIAANSSKWFGKRTSMQVNSGDTIVVPLDTQKVSKIRLWTDVSSIIFNLAVTLGVINDIGD